MKQDNNEVVELTDASREASWRRYRESGMAELIGGHHLCLALAAAERGGLLQRLRDGAVHPEDLPPPTDPRLGRHLLRYLEIRGVVQADGDRYRPTDRGRRLIGEIPMAQLGFYLEAYGPVTERLGALLTGELGYDVDVARDGEALGRHCATLFEEYHTDTVLEAMRGAGATHLLDLGCGGGRFLVDACLKDPGLRGVGLDISAEAIDYARRLATEAGLQDRLEFVVGDAFDPASWPEVCRRADAMCAVGVLHEHFRDGEDAVIDILDLYAGLLREGVKSFILGEPEIYYDDRENDADLYLIHIFTEQGFPRRRERWLELFPRSQLRCRRLLRRPNAGPRFAFFDLVPADEGA